MTSTRKTGTKTSRARTSGAKPSRAKSTRARKPFLKAKEAPSGRTQFAELVYQMNLRAALEPDSGDKIPDLSANEVTAHETPRYELSRRHRSDDAARAFSETGDFPELFDAGAMRRNILS